MDTSAKDNRKGQQVASLNRISTMVLLVAFGCYLLLYLLFGELAMWFWKAISVVFLCAFAAALLFAVLSLRKKKTPGGVVLVIVNTLILLLLFVPLAETIYSEDQEEKIEVYCTRQKLEGREVYIIDSVSVIKSGSSLPPSNELVGQEMSIIFTTRKLYRSFERDAANCPQCTRYAFEGHWKISRRPYLEVRGYRVAEPAFLPE